MFVQTHLVHADAHHQFRVGAGISFAPEQRTRIKEYVVKDRVPTAILKERVTVGGRLPAEVELRSVPSDWGPSVNKYRYVYSDNRVYFVELRDQAHRSEERAPVSGE